MLTEEQVNQLIVDLGMWIGEAKQEAWRSWNYKQYNTADWLNGRIGAWERVVDTILVMLEDNHDRPVSGE